MSSTHSIRQDKLAALFLTSGDEVPQPRCGHPEGSFPAVLHVVHVLEVPLVAVAAVERLAAQLAGQVEVALALPAVTDETGLVDKRLAAVLAAVAMETADDARCGIQFWKGNHV